MKEMKNDELMQVPIDKIDRNPDNPRIVFRSGELESLMESIRQYGVRVPISVFKRGKKFILIDGERRFRCSLKLNKQTIPAIVQEEPTPLNNLLLMFNIHALREQWDLFTIAMKLPDVIRLLKKELGKEPTERDISAKTGLLVSKVRRCRILIDLPQQYKDLILDELHKPKSKQKLTEDMFIEMERALTRVSRTMPELVEERRDEIRDVLIEKYKSETIDNIVDFRLISKMASTTKIAEEKVSDAKKALKRLFQSNNYSAREAFNDSVSSLFQEKEVLSRINSLIDRIEEFDAEEIDDELRGALGTLVDKANELLER